VTDDPRVKQEEARLKGIARNFEIIEQGIGPHLRFEPVSGNESDQRKQLDKTQKHIISPDGERVGFVRVHRSGYSWQHKDDRTRLSSPRIPSRSRYGGRDGYRDYKNMDSVIAGVKKFCMPVTDDENRAEVLRKELRHYRDVLQGAYRRSLHIEGTGYGASPPVDRFINLLASDIGQDRVEGQEYIRILIRKRKVHNRFREWVMENFITPRQDELNALDTSKETVR